MYFSLLTTHPTDTKIPKNTTCKKKQGQNGAP